ncbi:MAG: HAD family phosphatase [Lachnospiraceae bacterium]|nr:HAD family phosphatase [Lachnospiraceae bacterium]
MLSNTDAVIFDLDGTLMDSMDLWSDIDIEYLGRYGCVPTPDMVAAIEGMSFTETAQYFKSRYAIPDSIEEIKKEWNRMAFQKYANDVQLKPGAARFLRALRQRKLPAAIASSNSQELIRAALANHQVEDCFDLIVTSCEVSKGKPSPDVYLYAADRLGVAPGRCLVFEDVPMGILAGKNAGMRVCAMEDDFSAARRVEIRRLADYYIRSYDEVLDGSYEVLREKERRGIMDSEQC